MDQDIKLRTADVKPIAQRAFPKYNGRKFELRVRETYKLQPDSGGGTFCDVVAVINRDGELHFEELGILNPYKMENHRRLLIPPDVMVIEHQHFCGKDMGLRFYVSPTSTFLQQMLPPALTI